MPSVNFRMTDEQHAALVADAAANDRSIQREIAHRVFRNGGLGAGEAVVGPGGRQGAATDSRTSSADPSAPAPSPIVADSEDRSVRGRTLAERPFRGMDQKPVSKPKATRR
jgi:hypothetical protein